MLTYTERARALRPYIVKSAVSLTDEDAIEAIELFPAWSVGTAYQVNERVQYHGVLYRVVQAHTSQEDWAPDVTKALFVVVSLDEWPEWVQPAGAHDAYAKDAKVTHNGKKWTSDVDANVWEPGVYGWTEYVVEVQ